MKKYLLSVMSLLSIGMAQAAETSNDAIYVWLSGTSTCYKLESMPQVSYGEGKAVLTLSGKSTPELILSLTDGAQLEVTYGIYQDQASGIDGVSNVTESRVIKNGKYITGGHLVIVKDGKKYDSRGVEIK